MPADFTAIVTSEADAVERFVTLLTQESDCLKNGTIEPLPTIVLEKEKLAVELNKLAQQRAACLTDAGLANDRTGMDQWLARHATQKVVHDTWQRILSLAAKARELNRLNGTLIELRAQYNDRALEILQARGRDGALDLYGPDGLTSANVDRKINDSV